MIPLFLLLPLVCKLCTKTLIYYLRGSIRSVCSVFSCYEEGPARYHTSDAKGNWHINENSEISIEIWWYSLTKFCESVPLKSRFEKLFLKDIVEVFSLFQNIERSSD